MKLSDPLVCICIPNYNGEETISATLNSLLSQTYTNIIIKIYDNASTDSSLKILRGFEAKYSNVYVFESRVNIGAEANFTRCIENMEGEYAAIYHSDDIYLPTIVEEQVAYLKSDENMVAVSSNAFRYDSHNQKKSVLYDFSNLEFQSGIFKINSKPDFLKFILRNGNVINCPSVMSRTEIYKKHIVFWNGEVFKTSADLDVWLRMSEMGSFGIIEKPLINYRVSTSSYSYNLARVRMNRSDMFLVLDSYMSSDDRPKNLSYGDLSNYEVLSFLDFLLIATNCNLSMNKVWFWKFRRKYKVSFLFFYFFKKITKKKILIFSFYFLTLLAPKNKMIMRFLFDLRYGS